MKCNRCGKEIEESEIFCNDCKKIFRNVSSRSEVKELEELIENQKKLTDLENTIELVNLDSLVAEELEKEDSLVAEELEKEDINQETSVIEEVKEEKQEEIKKEEKKSKKNNKKKLIVIISIISIILIIGIILLCVFLGKDKKEEKQVIIDYEKVINNYGDSITKIVEEYIESNEDIPTWQYVIEKLDYDKYEVNCSTHNIYSDGSIYLSSCKVNNKKTKYTYGKEQEEVKEGKNIQIYKQNNNGNIIYSNNNGSLVGTVTCKTEDCEYINAYDNYVLIKEDSEYYIYDYINNTINFGPFIYENENNILTDNNILYGIFYKEENINNIYSVQVKKVLKNIQGTLYNKRNNLDPTIMYKYNYVIMENNNRHDFINLKTGNVSYTIKENIKEFIEDKNIVYITAYTNDINKFKIYNSNGKLLFGGEEYSNFIISKNILVSNNTNFKVYDEDLKLKTNSKTYDGILDFNEEFVVVTKNSDLIILDLEDKVLATYEYSLDNYIYHKDLTKKDNKGIYITIENKKIPSNKEGRYIEYYYIFSTKESGLNYK